MKCFIICIAMVTAGTAAGCDDLGSPAELDRPRVLAVRVEPPHLPAGATATIDVLVGDASGRVAVVAPTAVDAMLDAPGLVTHGDDGWIVTAPPAEGLAAIRAQFGLAPTDPVQLPLDVHVVVDGEELTALKVVALGADGANPAVGGMTVAGTAPAGGAVVASIGELALAPVGVAGAGVLAYAWYSSIGDLTGYKSETATLTADAPGDGQVVLVVRDDQLGVGWTATDVRIE